MPILLNFLYPPTSSQILFMSENPKAFVSYSWDNDAHKQWVKSLADKLIGNGVTVIIDQYDCPPGTNFPHFMEQAVTLADRVLVVLTEKYKVKSDGREKGVGYEGMVISTEIYDDGLTNKFIPLLRTGDHIASTPILMRGRAGLDFRSDEAFEDQFEILLKVIFNYTDKPTPGSRPKFTSKLDVPSFALLKKMSNSEKLSKINLMISDNEIDKVCQILMKCSSSIKFGIPAVIRRDYTEIQTSFQKSIISKREKTSKEILLLDRLYSLMNDLSDKDLDEIEIN